MKSAESHDKLIYIPKKLTIKTYKMDKYYILMEHTPKICLNMIVKNESSKIITRLLIAL